MIKQLSLLALLCFLMACSTRNSDSAGNAEIQDTPPVEATPQKSTIPLVEQLEAAHQVDLFKSKEVVAFDLTLFFRGKKRLEARLTTTTNSDKIRLEKVDGTTAVFDGENTIVSPANAEYKGARFDIFTWQYFFMAPYKLSDPGTQWTTLSDHNIEGQDYERGKLTFDPGTGDAPKDWYIAYRNKETGMMDILAYIVTYSKSVAEAEVEPHAISYAKFQEVDGIPFATDWQFWLWTAEKGIFDQLGYAEISNIEFLEMDEALFTLSEDQRLVEKN